MSKIEDGLIIIKALGLPKAQHNDRTSLTLLALLSLAPDGAWKDIKSPLMGITPIIDYASTAYGVNYKPNTRESVRKESIHQLVDAGIVLRNPDDPKRSVNSPKTVYQIQENVLELLKTYGSISWETSLRNYLSSIKTLVAKYAKEREMHLIPVRIADGKEIKISSGAHSVLIKAIIEDFGSRFVPGGELIYAGDTGEKWGYFNNELLTKLGVNVDSHGKMPDVVLFYPEKNWLLLIESVTSTGPVDGKRHEELSKLFSNSIAPLVYVTAFPSRSAMSSYLPIIAWETEVWCADAPTHLIHFNGSRFLGPYNNKK